MLTLESNNSAIETAKIIELIKDRDEIGLSTLYDAYSGALLGIIIRIVGDKGIAEDILQKTMLKVWTKIDSYDSKKSTLYTCVTTIARHSAIDQVRLVGFDNLRKTDSLNANVYDVNTTQLSSDGIDVERLMSKLDTKYKDVLDAVYLQGYSQSEAAKKLDIPLGTVKTRVKGAISILRQELVTEKKLFFGILLFILILIYSQIWL